MLKTPTPFGITGGFIVVSQLRAYSVVCVFLIEKKKDPHDHHHLSLLIHPTAAHI